jgi:pyrroloquinoline quinone biosynthesis protein D
MSARVIIAAESAPRLRPHARLQFDRARERWVVLAPERVLVPDEIGLEVLQACDGIATVAAICGQLARKYETAIDEVQRDVIELLQELADKGIVSA